MTLLVTYASAHGSTQEMAQHLAAQLQLSGFAIDLKPVDEVKTLENYTAVILGSPIHCGLWMPNMHMWVSHQRSSLAQIPVYAWITCVRVLEPDGYAHVRTHYIPADFRALPTLRSMEIFPGRIIPPQLTWQEKNDLYVRYDGHFNITYAQGDYRDWPRFEEWEQWIAADLHTLNQPSL
jgi:menaquinone-dependent protoporphyrinogen oxidase